MPIDVTCAGCGAIIRIRDNAPARITCANCLAPLINPVAAESLATRAPLRVVPVAEQAASDEIRTNRIILITGVLLLVGGMIGFISSTGDLGFIGVLALLASVTLLVIGIRRQAPVKAMAPPAEAFASSSPAPASSILDYQNRREARRQVGRASPGAFAAGFFAALATCAAGVGMLLMSLQGKSKGSPLVLSVVILMVVGFIVASAYLSGRWRSFGPGALVGMILGMMALGPCAACYTGTLR